MSKHLTPVRAIKIYCKESCCAGDLKSWKECSRKVCPLFAYRLGKRPKQDITKQTSDKKHIDSIQDSNKIKPSEEQEKLL
jgi:hypothetical protein